MARAGGGHIINISSQGATLETPCHYGPTKAALERWTLAIAHELRPDNIGASVLYPDGPIDTPGIRFLPTPSRPVMRPPEDMGRAAVWIAEQEPLAVTGKRFVDIEVLQSL